VGNNKKGVDNILFLEHIHLLFFQVSWLLEVAFLQPRELKKTSSKSIILFENMSPSSSNCLMGVHGSGGEIYVTMEGPIRALTQESRLTFCMKG